MNKMTNLNAVQPHIIVEINMEVNEQIEMIKKYGSKNSCYKPFIGGVFYPLHSQDFVRTGFLKIAPTLSARDYKDAKCVIVRK